MHESLAGAPVGLAVGVDDVLVDAPSDFDCDVLITGEQIKNLVLLARGEQARSGVQDTPRLVQGISDAAALLNPVNPSIATISIPSRQAWGRVASQVLEDLLGIGPGPCPADARDHCGLGRA